MSNSNSNFIYGLFLFTSINIIYSFIKDNIKKDNIKKHNNEIKNTILQANNNIISEFNNLYNKINNIEQNINYVNQKLTSNNEIINDIDIKINKLSIFIDIKKIDKSTSTTELFDISNQIISKPDLYPNDTVFIESENDLIDDVYDYLPCQNFKKQTVYDILLHNLIK